MQETPIDTVKKSRLSFNRQKLLSHSAVLTLILLTLYFKFFSLGFSDYQGDEGKALYNPGHPDISGYLLDQRKGPLQFLTTYVYSLFDVDYSNYFMARFPFALASALSVLFFYLTAKLFFGKKAAFYGTLLFLLNGLFIAFGRIVQYQSYVILFSIMSVYFFALLHFSKKWSPAGLYYGTFFWAMGVLAHYDAVFIAPIVIYLVGSWVWQKKNWKYSLKHLLLCSVIPIILCSSFYIPYVLNISSSTSSYWQSRISGGEEKISSSIYTFVLYNQLPVLVGYFIFLIFFTFFALFNVYNKKLLSMLVPFVFWILVPFVFMEVLVNVPGTHFYTYLIPLLMLMGAGIAFALNMKIVKWPVGALIGAFFVVHTVIQHLVYIDNTKFYPWEAESLGPLQFEMPNKDYHLSLFGFPYNNYWKYTKSFMSAYPVGSLYNTNDRESISSIYLPRFVIEKDQPRYYVYTTFKQKIPGEIPKKIKYRINNSEPIQVYRQCTHQELWNKGFVHYFKEKVIGDVTPYGCSGQILVKIFHFD
jgi:hypothetical protein